MIEAASSGSVELVKRIEQLEAELAELKGHVPKEALAIGVINGDLDNVIASFIIALGAAAYDMEVDMFFTFWATAALRDPKKRAKKTHFEKLFGWMLPRGSRKLGLSKMNMAGMGPLMIRGLMKNKGVDSLEKMIQSAGELGIRIHVCEMSMDLMGFKKEEMIDYPQLDFVGVGSFIDMAQDAKQTFFM